MAQEVIISKKTKNAIIKGVIIKDQEGDMALVTSPYITRALKSKTKDPCRRINRNKFGCVPNSKMEIAGIPNDPGFGELKTFNGTQPVDLGIVNIWDGSTSCGDAAVAVLDTGIDYNHPDLADNIWVNTREIPGNGRDDDKNGYIDDVRGWNTINNNGETMDLHGHGTHVAGIIGAVGNNGIGIVGVNWSCKIIPVKVLWNEVGTTWWIMKGLNYVRKIKAEFKIPVVFVNMSLGGYVYFEDFEKLLNSMVKEKIIVVAAAGNNANDNDGEFKFYPAGYNSPNIISVASINDTGKLSSFSNYGVSSVHVAAPGEKVLSTVPGGGYLRLSGTSMAAPFVTGALANFYGFYKVSPNQLINIFLSSTKQNPEIHNKVITGGMLNMENYFSAPFIPVIDTQDCYRDELQICYDRTVKQYARKLQKLKAKRSLKKYRKVLKERNAEVLQCKLINYCSPDTRVKKTK